MEGGRGTGGDCGGETESRQAAHGEHAGWRIVQCAANLTLCKIDSREAKGNPAALRHRGHLAARLGAAPAGLGASLHHLVAAAETLAGPGASVAGVGAHATYGGMKLG